MSGVTVPLGFPYPTDADFVTQGDEAIQALAEAVDDYFVGASGVLVVGVSMTLNGSIARRRGQVGMALCSNLAAVAARAPGDTLFTLPVGFRPSVAWYGLLKSTTGVIYTILIGVDGTCKTSEAIAAGQSIYGALTYPL